MKNEAHKMKDHDSIRPFNKEVSNLWKHPTPKKASLALFMPMTLATPLNHPEPRKSQGMDSLFSLSLYSTPEQFSNPGVLFFYFQQISTQNSHDLEKSTSYCSS